MFKNTIFRRMTALVLTLALAAAAALPGLAVYPMPIQTASETEAVYQRRHRQDHPEPEC